MELNELDRLTENGPVYERQGEAQQQRKEWENSALLSYLGKQSIRFNDCLDACTHIASFAALFGENERPLPGGSTGAYGSCTAGRDKQRLRKDWLELDGRRGIAAWRSPCGDTAISGAPALR